MRHDTYDKILLKIFHLLLIFLSNIHTQEFSVYSIVLKKMISVYI